jgi:hypothetical protein
MILKIRSARAASFLTGALAALSLAACDKTPAANQAAAAAPVGAVPLDPNAPATPPAYAPAASALPPAPPARIIRPRSREARYGYVARAEAFNTGLADSPPDYAVDYQGARPWYWRAQNGAFRVVEATPGGDRYYYYEPGADQPFLVRDPTYAYGYDNGELAVVYDASGRALPDDVAARQADRAGRYLARARALYAAARQGQHEAAYAAYWQARQNDLKRQQQDWASQRQQNADWRAWQSQNAGDADAWRREADARRAYDLANAPRSAPAYPAAPAGNQTHDQRGPGPMAGPAVTPQSPPPAPAQPGLLDAAKRAQQDQVAAESARRAQQAQAQQAQAQQAQALAANQARLARVQQEDAQKAQAEAARRTAAAQQAAQQAAQRAAQAQAHQAQAQQQAQAANQARLARLSEQQDAQRAQAEAAHRSAAAEQAAQAQARQAQAQQQAQAANQARLARLSQQQDAQKAQAEAARRAEAAKQEARAKARQAQAQALAAKPEKPREDKAAPPAPPPK